MAFLSSSTFSESTITFELVDSINVFAVSKVAHSFVTKIGWREEYSQIVRKEEGYTSSWWRKNDDEDTTEQLGS